MPLVSMGTVWYVPFCPDFWRTFAPSSHLAWPERGDCHASNLSKAMAMALALLTLTRRNPWLSSAVTCLLTISIGTVMPRGNRYGVSTPNEMLRKVNPALVMIAHQGRQQDGYSLAPLHDDLYDLPP